MFETLSDRLTQVFSSLRGRGRLSPADIEAICRSAIRNAFSRSRSDSEIPPLVESDFERAIRRVSVPA